MNKEQFIQRQQEEFEEAQHRSICNDAAVMVAELGISRDEAIKQAQEIADNQQEAMSDVTGTLETMEEYQSPTPSPEKQAQIKAVSNALYNQFFG